VSPVGSLPGVSKVENAPGQGGALPRGPESHVDLPARARPLLADRGPAGDEQPPTPRTGRRWAAVLRSLWVLALVALAVGLAALHAVDGPTLARQSLAAGLGVILAIGLGVRSGAHLPLATALALVVGVAAVATQWEPLLGGAAVGTGVLAACLAVLATRPAATFRLVVIEVVIALAVAVAGGLAAEGFAVGLDAERFGYTVLALAMVGTTALVYRLAGGMHSLGRRGLILATAALVLLVVVLVYTAALTRYGSPELVEQVRSAQAWARDHLGGVPHPVEVLVGIPALAWGVSMRSRRRQGWWACAFGTAATAHVASDLLGAGDTVRSSGLAGLYSLVLGLLLGYLLIKLERALTGRGDGPSRVQRLEPSRLRPLH
jgi:hypothetical protein